MTGVPWRANAETTRWVQPRTVAASCERPWPCRAELAHADRRAGTTAHGELRVPGARGERDREAHRASRVQGDVALRREYLPLAVLAALLGLHLSARIGERFREDAGRLAGLALVAPGVYLLVQQPGQR